MTVLISVADPDRGDTFAVDAALVLIGRTSQGRAIHFVLTERTVDVVVATLIRINAPIRQRSIASALELRTEASVTLAVLLVRAIAAVGVAVAQQRRMHAVAVFALELTWHAGERTAIGWLVRPVAAIVLLTIKNQLNKSIYYKAVFILNMYILYIFV